MQLGQQVKTEYRLTCSQAADRCRSLGVDHTARSYETKVHDFVARQGPRAPLNDGIDPREPLAIEMSVLIQETADSRSASLSRSADQADVA